MDDFREFLDQSDVDKILAEIDPPKVDFLPPCDGTTLTLDRIREAMEMVQESTGIRGMLTNKPADLYRPIMSLSKEDDAKAETMKYRFDWAMPVYRSHKSLVRMTVA
jgi:hypothetical protein